MDLELCVRGVLRHEVYRGASLLSKRLLLGPCSRPMPRALWLPCRGNSLIRNNLSLGRYSRLTPRALWWFSGGVVSYE